MSTYNLKFEPVELALSLSRVGGQGSKGNSVSNAQINADGDLIITIVDALGATVQTINAGAATGATSVTINGISDVDAASPADTDTLHYDGGTSRWKTRKTTTNDIDDINNASKAEGALLVYNSTTSKYEATVQINNANTQINGGTY